MPGTHQYAVTLVAQIVAQILGLFWKSLLVDKVSWYMRFFLILPNKYYTFVTSPFLSASPSPAPFCSIFRSPNRLDLWLDLCLKLLFSWTKSAEGDKRCCGWHLSQIRGFFWSVLGGRSPSYHQQTSPKPTNMRSHVWRKLWRRFWGFFWSRIWSTKYCGIWGFCSFYLINTILSWHSPSPAPVCSIFGGPNRLDLWLDLCLKLLFDCHKNEGLLHISFTATFYSLQKFPNSSIRLSSLWSGTMVSQNHNCTYRMTKCHDQSR